MRLVRQVDVPGRENRERHWKEGAEDLLFDIEVRLDEGLNP